MRQIFVHGLGQDSSSWRDTISELPILNEILCPDLEAIIKEAEEYNYENMYRAFSRYCNESDDLVNICGLSLGGILALNYAIDYPKKVASLILIAPQFKMPKLLLKFQNVIFYLMPKSAFREMGVDKRDLIKFTNSMMDLDFSKQIENIECKTLVLFGEKDKTNRSACEKLAKRVPGATIKCIKNSGHEVNMDAPIQLAAEINHFINGVNREDENH